MASILDKKEAEELIRNCVDRAKRGVETEEIAVLAFAGNAGSGKTTIIKELLKEHSDIRGRTIALENNREVIKEVDGFTIKNGGVKGTSGFIVYQSKDLLCIDMEGKGNDQNQSEYVGMIQEFIEKYIRLLENEKQETNKQKGWWYSVSRYQSKTTEFKPVIHFLILVASAVADRDDDANVLRGTAEAICKKHNCPFILAINKMDTVDKECSRYKKRYSELSTAVNHVNRNYLLNLFQKSYEVPIVQLTAQVEVPIHNCPECNESSDYLYTKGIGSCEKCSVAITTMELDAAKNHRLGRGIGRFITPRANISPIESLIHTYLSPVVFQQYVQSFVIGYEDSLRNCARIIEDRHVTKVLYKSDLSNLDESMCREICITFKFRAQSDTHGQFEKLCWGPLSDSWREYLFRGMKEADIEKFRNHLCAWGIYYARKYYKLAKMLVPIDEKDNAQELVSKAADFLKTFSRDQVDLIEKRINSRGRAAAYVYYLQPENANLA